MALYSHDLIPKTSIPSILMRAATTCWECPANVIIAFPAFCKVRQSGMRTKVSMFCSGPSDKPLERQA